MTRRLALLLLTVLTLYLTPAHATLQFISGFELGSTGECIVISGSPTVESSVVRSGTYALQVNVTATTAYCQLRIRTSSINLNVFESIRFYLRVASLPSTNDKIVSWINGSGEVFYLKLSTAGALILGDPTDGDSGASSTTIAADGNWHLIQVNLSSTASTVFLDSQSVATFAHGLATQANAIRLGSNTAATTNLYFDDFVADDSTSGTTIASGKDVMLLPTADSSLSTWVGGAGGTTNTFQAVDSVPPVGVVNTSATNTSQIRNTASAVNQDATYTMQTYSAAGLNLGVTVNAVMALANTAWESSTSFVSGSVWVASNPSQTAGGGPAWQFGNGSSGVVINTFPTGWATVLGAVTVSPTVTLSVAPTVTLRRVSTSSGLAVDADFIGMYVDYSPSAAVNNNVEVIE